MFIIVLFLLVSLVGTWMVRIGMGIIPAALGFCNDLILDTANNFIPRVSSSGRIRLSWWTLEYSAVS